MVVVVSNGIGRLPTESSPLLSADPASAGIAKATEKSQKATINDRAKCILFLQVCVIRLEHSQEPELLKGYRLPTKYELESAREE